MQIPFTRAVLWKEYRERRLTFLALLLLPALTAAVAWSACPRELRDEYAPSGALAMAYLCALLAGVTLTGGNDDQGSFAFERKLPQSPIALWAAKFLLGMLAFGFIALLTLAACYAKDYADGRIGSTSRMPLQFLSGTFMLYAIGTYFSCCTQTNMGATGLGLLCSGTVFFLGISWNARPWMHTAAGLYESQTLSAAMMMTVATVIAFRGRIRVGDFTRRRRLAFAGAGFVLAGLGASAPGLSRIVDWLHLDPSDLTFRSFSMAATPDGSRVLLGARGSTRYQGSRPLQDAQVKLIYDAKTGSMTRFYGRLFTNEAKWSPDGNRLLLARCGYDPTRDGMVLIRFAGDEVHRQLLPRWVSAEWLSDTRLAVWRCSASNRYARKSYVSMYDVSTQRYTGEHETHARGHRLLGVRDGRYWCLNASYWSPQMKTRKTRMHQVDLQDGSEHTFDLPADSYIVGTSPGARLLLLRSHDHDGRRFNRLSLYHVETQSVRRLAASDGEEWSSAHSGQWAFSPNGKWFATVWPEKGKKTPRRLEACHLGSGESYFLGLCSYWAQVRFSPDSRRVVAVRNREGAIVKPLPGEQAGVCRIPRLPGTASHLTCEWLGNDRLLVQVRMWSPKGPPDDLPEPLRSPLEVGCPTLWVADLNTQEIRMIWPSKWVHPSWRVEAVSPSKEAQP